MKSLSLSVCLFLILNGLPLAVVAQSDSSPSKPVKEEETEQPDANPAEPTKDKRNIRFQFEGVPYMDALQRFSQMTEKPLIAE
ncbi:MAG TPA: hypothetical protein QF478_06070, partial [Verrucomicrobiota bacterium]|nr:hypothetical protein [Verrucomicrobiota bacterium]